MLKKLISLLILFTLLFNPIINIPVSNNLVFASDTKANSAELRYIRLNNGNNLYLEVGDIKTLELTFNPTNARYSEVTFYSSDKSIVSIDKTGTIKALKTGKVVLTAEVDGKKSSVYANVYINNNLKATFKETDTIKEKIKTITINVTSKDTDVESFYIYLPSGYMVEGTTASFPADMNGVYPFTVYDNTNSKKTFYYEVKGLKESYKYDSQIDDLNKSDFDLNILYNNLSLQYDYEKKQCLLNAELDKVRTVKLPNNSTVDTKEINYYVPNIANNKLLDYTIDVEGKELNVKLLRQGEFYLMIIWQESERDARNIFVSYRAYNFATPQEIITEPEMDYITSNGTYEILAYSNSGLKELFKFNIKDIDFMHPSVSTMISHENKFVLQLKDNLNLDYIITYDGKYVKIPDSYKANTEFEYIHPDEFKYNGEYVFICVDKSGNRTIEIVDIKDKRSVYYTKKLELNVHNTPHIKTMFSNIGDSYYYDTSKNTYYNNIFPAYMNGINNNTFSPNGTITRGQMVAILCRINDLPYDIGLLGKTKLNDIDGHWASNYIAMAVSKRYIQGYKDKSFKPDNALSRAEFAKMINNISTLKSKISSIPAVNNYVFTDITEAYNYAKADILKLANRGIMNASGNKFNPGAAITRAEVIFAINRLYDLSPSDEEFTQIEQLYNKYYNFKDIKNNPYYKDIIISVIGMYREEK